MRGHKVCFRCEIRKIIFELLSILHPISSSEFDLDLREIVLDGEKSYNQRNMVFDNHFKMISENSVNSSKNILHGYL